MKWLVCLMFWIGMIKIMMSKNMIIVLISLELCTVSVCSLMMISPEMVSNIQALVSLMVFGAMESVIGLIMVVNTFRLISQTSSGLSSVSFI
nr:NADH dehydrogenase subunit 4L [Penenirmus auritus]